MTDEEAFNILQLAEDMSHRNWMHFKLLYNNKFREAEYRIKELEAALRRIAHAPHGKVYCADGYEEAVLIARAALGEKADEAD